MDPILSLLIVDDNRPFIQALSAFIEDCAPGEFRVCGAAQTGREGIRLASALRPEVVLLDLNLPDLSGFAVIPLIRLDSPSVKIIATTQLSAAVFEQAGCLYLAESLKAGADAFIPKFNLARDLAGVVRLMLPLNRPEF